MVLTGYPAAASRAAAAVVARSMAAWAELRGGEPDRVRGAGPAVQALQYLQREVDGVAVVGGDGVDPDDADAGGSRGHAEGEDLPDAGPGGAREGGPEHHRRDGSAGAGGGISRW